MYYILVPRIDGGTIVLGRTLKQIIKRLKERFEEVFESPEYYDEETINHVNHILTLTNINDIKDYYNEHLNENDWMTTG